MGTQLVPTDSRLGGMLASRKTSEGGKMVKPPAIAEQLKPGLQQSRAARRMPFTEMPAHLLVKGTPGTKMC